jgi:succinate dehydrogenase/fumarate reductase flavoprotein subunit
MADDDDQPPENPSGEGNIEGRVSTLESKIDDILGILKGGGQPAQSDASQGRADGSNAAEEVRRQLDERDAKRAADEKERAAGDRLDALEATVRDLAEVKPIPPVRAIERFMGWAG